MRQKIGRTAADDTAACLGVSAERSGSAGWVGGEPTTMILRRSEEAIVGAEERVLMARRKSVHCLERELYRNIELAAKNERDVGGRE